MSVITFWNNNTGKIGQTHSAMAIANYMAVEHNYKILLISTRYNDDVTNQAYGLNMQAETVKSLVNNKNTMDMESGIEGLAKLALSKRLTPEMIPNYTRMILRNRLEIIAGPIKKENDDQDIDYERIYGSCKSIINIARQYYDIVFVDLNNGKEDPVTEEIIKKSNVVIANIEQKQTELDKMAELRKNFLPEAGTLILMNRYDRESKYSYKNATRFLNEKKDLLAVPYCTLYAEAVQDGRLAEFFLNPKLRKMQDTTDKNAFFMSELKRDCDAIIYKMQELQMRIG